MTLKKGIAISAFPPSKVVIVNITFKISHFCIDRGYAFARLLPVPTAAADQNDQKQMLE